MDVTRLLRYSREDLAKATCRKSRFVVVDPRSRRIVREQRSTRGVKVPNWECPNWTELPTIRHSLAAKPSTKRKKRKKTRSFYRVPLFDNEFTRRNDVGVVRGEISRR